MFINFHFFVPKSLHTKFGKKWPKLQNLTLRLNKSGQPWDVIFKNYDGLESQMLHTKFRGKRLAGCGVKIFEGFLPYIGMVAILAM